MSRTYRRTKTEKGHRMPKQEISRNKRIWKESREQTIDIREMSNMGYFETV